jgi:hypothetical protein
VKHHFVEKMTTSIKTLVPPTFYHRHLLCCLPRAGSVDQIDAFLPKEQKEARNITYKRHFVLYISIFLITI